jgi:phage replication-related protein YjqB (UPF0714/DUF867 family)
MPDTYRNFDQLAEHETQDVAFSIQVVDRNEALAIIAPHGGSVEPGTSELADAIAGSTFSFYAFEGTKNAGNAVLHITSTRFDEPRGHALVSNSRKAIAIHGEDGKESIVLLGGRETEFLGQLKTAHEESGFRVQTRFREYLQSHHEWLWRPP